MAKRSDFRTALLSSARQARAEGAITALQYLAIWLAPSAKIAKAQEYVTHEATMAGLMAPTADPSAFDWSSLLAFIKELLPLILQIISIFTAKGVADAAAVVVLVLSMVFSSSAQAQCRSCPGTAAAPTIVTPCDADRCPTPALTPAEAAALWPSVCVSGCSQPAAVRPLFSPGNACWWDRGPLRRLVSTPWRGRPAMRR